MLHIYYGFGKGKTSILNGTAVRASGANLKVVLYRFLKGRGTSEDDQLRKLGIKVVSHHPSTKFVIEMNVEEKALTEKTIFNDLELLKKDFLTADVIALDEVLDLIYLKFITEEWLIKFLKLIPNKTEVLLSGHYKFDKLFAQADLITYLKPERHYYEQGVKARKGIEY